MPYTATSLGHWMKAHHRLQLDCTVGTARLRRHHDVPHGAARKYHGYLGYSARFGTYYKQILPTGEEEDRLLVGLLADNHSLFAFNPLWAKRLPELHTLSDPAQMLAELPPGSVLPAPPPFRVGNEAAVERLYQKMNDDMDFWWRSECCCRPYPIWARYTPTGSLREQGGELWRRFESVNVQRFKEGTIAAAYVEAIPEERRATLGDFPDEVYLRENALRVVAQNGPQDELASVYEFYIFQPNSRFVVVNDTRANVIVAGLAGRGFFS